MRLPDAVIRERDARIFQAKVNGASYRQIAKAMNISEKTAHAGYLRELKRHSQLTNETSEFAGELIHEQLDELFKSLWPMTKERTVEIDGTEIKVPPDKDAVDRVLKIMTMRAKLLGLDKQVIQVDHNNRNAPELGAGDGPKEITSESMARELAIELIKANVLEGPVAEMIKKALENERRPEEEFIDAVVVEDSHDMKELVEARVRPESAPEWVDEEDGDVVPRAWVPKEASDTPVSAD